MNYKNDDTNFHLMTLKLQVRLNESPLTRIFVFFNDFISRKNIGVQVLKWKICRNYASQTDHNECTKLIKLLFFLGGI